MEEIKKVIIHAGVFHADDVMVVALVKKFINADVEVIRTFKVIEGDDTIVADIGGKYDGRRLFDHHQDDAPVNQKGSKYSACGQILEFLKSENLVDAALYAEIRRVIMAIDASDNYGKFDGFATLIAGFNPNWDSKGSPNDCFNKAVAIAIQYLENCIARVNSVLLAQTEVHEAMAKAGDNNILILERYLPFMDSVVDTHIEFVVYPGLRGGFNAQCVPVDKAHMNQPKKPFSTSLMGHDGVTFVHAAGFLLSARTVDEAIAACLKA